VSGLLVVRVAANAYQEPESSGLPGMGHYSPEQALVFLGPVGTPVITPREGAAVEISMTAGKQPATGQHGTVVWISGNAALVEQVLRQADWSVLRALRADPQVFAWTAYAVLIATGLWNIAAEHDEIHGQYRTTLWVKIGFVAASGVTVLGVTEPNRGGREWVLRSAHGSRTPKRCRSH